MAAAHRRPRRRRPAVPVRTMRAVPGVRRQLRCVALLLRGGVALLRCVALLWCVALLLGIAREALALRVEAARAGRRRARASARSDAAQRASQRAGCAMAAVVRAAAAAFARAASSSQPLARGGPRQLAARA